MLLRASTNNSTGIDIVTLPQMMPKLIQAHIFLLRAKGDAHTRKSQARYKHEYDSLVRKTPTFKNWSYVFLDRSPLRATLDITADAIAKKTYHNESRTMRPSCIISVQSIIVTSDDHKITYTVPIDRVTHGSTIKHNQPTTKICPQRQRIF